SGFASRTLFLPGELTAQERSCLQIPARDLRRPEIWSDTPIERVEERSALKPGRTPLVRKTCNTQHGTECCPAASVAGSRPANQPHSASTQHHQFEQARHR